MLDFSVCAAITKVVVGSSVSGLPLNRDGQPVGANRGSFRLLTDRFSPEVELLYSAQSVRQRVTFIDNHDRVRFLHASKANGDQRLLELALILLDTVPGIPVLDYGTEQGFHQPRARKGQGWGSDNRQNLWDSGYQADGELFRFIQTLNRLRVSRAALGRGFFEPLIVDGFGGEVLVYRRSIAGDQVSVVVNRGNRAVTVDLSPFGFRRGRLLLEGRDTGPSVRVDALSGVILGLEGNR